MRITGTKKLLITLLSLACAVATGLVVFFTSTAVSASAADAQEDIAIEYDYDLLQQIADETGYDFEIINFYAHVCDVGADRIYDELRLDRDGVVEDIALLMSEYAAGDFYYGGEEDIEDEEWFVAPDAVGSYATLYAVGLQDTWTQYYSPTKTLTTEKDLYWGNTNFALGPFTRWANVNSESPQPIGEMFQYTWVWLDEGEEYDFGIYSTIKYSNVYIGSERAETTYDANGNAVVGFFERYLTDFWFTSSGSVYRGQDPSQKTLQQYCDEYSTTDLHNPAASYTTANTTYMKFITTRTAAANQWNKVRITADAPSGVYYLLYQQPYANAAFRFVTWDTSSVWSPCPVTWTCAHNGWGRNTNYCEYKIIVNRSAITVPSVQADSGVNDERTARTVTYDATEQQMIINYDWGNGLIDYTITYTNGTGTTVTIPFNAGTTSGNYITYTNTAVDEYPDLKVTVKRAVTGRLSAVHEGMVITASEKGTYKISLRPSHQWADGTSTAKIYTFNIVDRELTKPSLQDSGDSGSTVSIVYDNGKEQYVSFHPVLQEYVTWSVKRWIASDSWDASQEIAGDDTQWVEDTSQAYISLSQWTNDGMLMLAGQTQGAYRITLSLKSTNNIKWEDGTTAPLEFTFVIGPRKITTNPTIINESGATVDNTARTQTIEYTSSNVRMSIQVNKEEVTSRAGYDSSNNFDMGLTNELGNVTYSDNIPIVDGVLTVYALNAGTYYVWLKPADTYCWTDTGTTEERVFTLIIRPKEITAPILKDADPNFLAQEGGDPVVKQVSDYQWEKTITFGGDSNSWYTLLTFSNAYETRISWNNVAGSNLDQLNWGDSLLELSAKVAGTYKVVFECKDNYILKDGEVFPEVTLVVNRLPIASPYIVYDYLDDTTKSDDTVRGTYTSASGSQLYGAADIASSAVLKTIDCDFELHTFTLYIGIQGSVTVTLNGNAGNTLSMEWDDEDRDNPNAQHTATHYYGSGEDRPYLRTTSYGYVMFTTASAGTYEIKLTPERDYCWGDRSTTSISFTFKINPSPVDALNWEINNNTHDEPYWKLQQDDSGKIIFNNGEGFPFDGEAKEVRIGSSQLDSTSSRPTGAFDSKWYDFYVIDEEGKYYNLNNLPEGMKIWDGGDGYLYFTAVNAGTYDIMVGIKDTDFCFNTSGMASETYTVSIGKQSMGTPYIEKHKDDSSFGYQVEYSDDNPTVQYGVYAGKDSGGAELRHTMYIIVNSKYENNIIVESVNEDDTDLKLEGWRKETLSDGTTKLIYVISASQAGTHSIVMYPADSNHKWATPSNGEYINEYVFSFDITPAPVLGVEAHYIVDADSDGNGGSDKGVGSTNLYGGSSVNTDNVGLNLKYTESDQFFYIKRTSPGTDSNGKDLLVEYVLASFRDQFDYKITGYLLNGDEIVVDSNYAVWAYSDDLSKTDGMLKFSVLDAGIYTIEITPKANYVWKQDKTSSGALELNRDPVKLIVSIDKMDVGVPEIANDGEPNTADVYDQSHNTKTIPFDKAGNTLSLLMGGHPDAFSIVSWNGLAWNTTGTILWSDYINTNGEDKRSLKATDTGTYTLVIELSNSNNYKWSSQYDTTTYTLVITQQGVATPTAWFVNDNSKSQGDIFDNIKAAIIDQVNSNSVVTGINSANLLKVSDTYDAESRYIYLVGDTLTLWQSGDIEIEIVTKTGNSDADGKQVLYQDSEGKWNVAYKFSAAKVNVYTIKVSFKTNASGATDYYWTGTGISNDTNPREFTLEIKTRYVDVPYFDGYKGQTLENNAYYAYFDFSGTTENIDIVGIESGKEITTGSSYAFINYSILHTDLVGADYLNYLGSDPNTNDGVLNMYTRVIASAKDDYCIILSVDSANVKWSTDDIIDKQFWIKIDKVEIEIPVIKSDTPLASQNEKHVQYTSFAADTQNILILDTISIYDGADNPLGTTLFATSSSNGKNMTGIYDTTDKLLKLSTDPDAGTYTVTISLNDPDNMKWKGSDNDITPLEYYLVVDPMPVAQPEIIVLTTEGNEGVVGFTKTVDYNGLNQEIKIGGFWSDFGWQDASLWNSSDNKWMNIKTEAKAWVDGVTVDFTKDPVYESNVFSSTVSTVYDDINKGLLTFTAMNAGEYKIIFELTPNAVWSNTSDDKKDKPIEIIFYIEKQQFATPVIYNNNDAEAVIDGRTKTYEYKLDPVTGNAVVRTMRIDKYDPDIMALDTANVDSKVTLDPGNTYYNFLASQADTYTLTFELLDFANQRWEFADQKDITFTFQINKLTLKTPVQTAEFQLPLESVDVVNNTLSVDFDNREHSMLLLNMIEKYTEGDPYYFMWYEDTTTYTGNMTALQIVHYYTTAGMTVGQIFGSDYYGAKVNEYVQIEGETLVNVLTIKAMQTGTYTFVIHIADAANMQWADGSADDLEFTLTINKMIHDAPTVAKGTPRSIQYTGDYVEFIIQDVYNSCNTEDEYINGTGMGFDYEKYEIISYEGNRTVDLTTNPSMYEVSWYNGYLTLRFKEVGTYYVKITINLPDYTEWGNHTTDNITIPLTVLPRELTAEFTFSSTDEATNADLKLGSNSWARSTPVTATLTLYNLVTDNPNNLPENNLEIIIYGNDTLVVADTILSTDTIRWSWEVQPDGTWKVWCTFVNLPCAPTDNVVIGNYTLFVEQLDTDDSNYTILSNTASQNYTIKADPAPFDPTQIVWQYYNSISPIKWKASEGQDSANRLHVDYLTSGGTWYVEMTVNGYTNLADALSDGKVKIDRVAGDSAAQNAGNYSYTVYITADDPTMYSFPTTGYTLYYTVDPALYNLSDVEWAYGSDEEYVYEIGKEYSVHVTNLPDGLTDKNYIVVNYSSNKQINAGVYTTTVNFQTQTSNYVTPVFDPVTGQGDTTTYEGTFEWTFTWEIAKQNITVGWDGDTYESDGEMFNCNPVVDDHQEKFDYRYYVIANDTATGYTLQLVDGEWKYVNANGDEYKGIYVIHEDDSGVTRVYVEISSITGSAGSGTTFYIEAYLKSAYVNNYTFNMLGEDFKTGNFREFEFTSGATLYDHIIINAQADSSSTAASPKYIYTGAPLEAEVVIDFDTTGGALENGDIEIVSLYYLQSDPDNPLSYIPWDIGSYTFKAKLVIRRGSTIYELSQSEYNYEIVKASFNLNEFVWQYRHTNTDGTETVAEYDTVQGLWKDVETGAVVNFVYDGKAHEINLISNNAYIIPILSQGYNYTAASTYDDTTASYVPYTAEIVFRFANNGDENRYNLPEGPFSSYKTITDENGDPVLDIDNNPLTMFIWSIDWVVEKQVLDLSLVEWDYTNDYIYERVNGKATSYTVDLTGVPTYLKDKISFVTTLGDKQVNDADTTNAGTYTDAGQYTTVATIDTDSINYDNYILPAGSATTYTLNWEIAVRMLDLPQVQSDYDWTNFDGNLHNFLTVFGIQADWEEYFTIKVTYANLDGGAESVYDGTKDYGSAYLAFNAGDYKLTFAILPELFDETSANVAWRVPMGTADGTTDDQVVTLTVNKATFTVIDWNKDYESSTVKLDGNANASKFLDYEFYEGDGISGNKVTLDDVLAAASGVTYSITPVVKTEYGSNIQLNFLNSSDQYYKFDTRDIDELGGVAIGNKPWIAGYTDETGDHYYQGQELEDIKSGAIVPTVIYTGSPITFIVYNWSVYQNYVEVWNGDVSDLTQTDTGLYSVKLVLKTDEKSIYYWTKTDDVADRSSATLSFEIKYLMIPIPEIDQNVYYTSDAVDILKHSMGESEYEAWFNEYNDYFEITGTTSATKVGDYKLYLTIRDECSLSVRWDDGSANGIAGTYSAAWSIDYIYLKVPVLNSSASITYDRQTHEVYEVLQGYNEDASLMDEDLLKLKQYIGLFEGGQGVDANTYTAVFTLPNRNYMWVDQNGNTLTSDTVEISWKIEKATISLENVTWDYTEPFAFTIVNGQPYNHKVQLINLPDELQDYVSYITDGKAGNGSYEIGTHTTSFVLDTSRLDRNNYNVGALPTTVSKSLTWEITTRTFEFPEYDGSWKYFDGQVHDLMILLGYEEGWENYFDVKVQYAPDFRSYKDYNDSNYGNLLEAVGFSVYKGFYVGGYQITISLKAEYAGKSIFWADGSYTGEKLEQIECEKLDIFISDWIDNGKDSTAVVDLEKSNISDFFIDENGDLKDEIWEMFDYVIYESGDVGATRTPIDPDDVKSGVAYYIELQVKSAYASGIVISGTLFFDFGVYDYGNQPITWLPLPTLTNSEMQYTGKELTFEIDGYDSVYKISALDRLTLIYTYYVDLTASDTHYISVMGGLESLTQTAAGEYSAVIRFNSKINLSWYDPTKYSVNSDNNLVDASGNEISDTTSYINRTAQTLTFTITEKGVEPIDMSVFDGIIPDLTYNGEEQDITHAEELEEIFYGTDGLGGLVGKYGDVIEITGNKYTDVKDEGKYKLTISLRDPSSSYWQYRADDTTTGYTLKYVNHTLKYVDEDGNEFDGMYRGGKYATILSYVLDEDGNFTYEDNNKVFDPENSYVIFTDTDYSFEWEMKPKAIPAPEIDGHIYYDGSEIFVGKTDAIKGFDADYMEITKGASATSVGDYTATVKLTSLNYVWESGEETEEFDWSIEKASVDLSGVTWKISADNPVYTRENGKAVVYYVYLDGLPEELKDHVQYTTNNKVGAYAGISAGTYETVFKFINLGDNFEDIIIPDSLKDPFVWHIEMRVLDVPSTNNSVLVFDNEKHDLLDMLGLDRDGDWKEYYSIEVWYSSDFSNYELYKGYNGDAYTAFGSGAYLIKINLLTGINNGSIINVVWRASNSDSSDTSNGAEEQFIAPSSLSLNSLLRTVSNAPYIMPLDETEEVEEETEDETEGDEGDESGDVAGGEEEDEDEDEIGSDAIADPIVGENPGDGYLEEVPDITVGIEKRTLTIISWTGSNASAFVKLKDGEGQYLAWLEPVYYDSDGNIVTLEEISKNGKEGSTYFIHVGVKEIYEDYVELIFEDGVQKTFEFTTPFGKDTTLTGIPKIDITIDAYAYSGSIISVKEQIEELLKDYAGILKVVISESDDLEQINVGSYVITICFEDGAEYCWEPVDRGDRSAVRINWTIDQAIINGTWDDSGRLDLSSESYTGSYAGLIEVKYTDATTGESIAFTDLKVGGTYIAEVVIKDETRFKYVGELTHEFTLTTELIFKDRPTLDQTEYSYTGQDIQVLITNWTEYQQYIKLVEGSLTESEVGEYTLEFEITDPKFSWSDGLTENITLTFTIGKAILSGTWDVGTCSLNLSSTYLGSYDTIVRYEIYDSNGKLISKDEMQQGQTYTVKAILIDEAHFEWAEGMQTTVTFTFDKEIERLDLPVMINAELGYTGTLQQFTIKDWDTKYSQYLEIVTGSDSLSQKNAGTYKVTLRFKNSQATWKDGTSSEITIEFTIAKAILKGDWGNDGKVQFESSYTGNYNDIVDYVYYTMDGELVKASQLKEGVSYMAIVRLKDTANCEFAEDFQDTCVFVYEKSKSTFPWWLILIIILAIILLIIIIIIIIMVIKRRIEARKRAQAEEEDYSDLYGDENGNEGGEEEDYSDIYGGDDVDLEGGDAEDYSDIYGGDDEGSDPDGYDDTYTES